MTHKLITNAKRDKLLTNCESLILQGYDSILPLEKQQEIKIFELAQFVHNLPDRQKNFVMKKVRGEIEKRNRRKEINQIH